MRAGLRLVVGLVLVGPAMSIGSGRALGAVEDLVLNEFLASNRSGLLDENNEASDWIEVHNAGGTAVNLGGLALTDDADDNDKWIFPGVSLPAGGYLVVFASGKDRRPVGGSPLHTNFQLNAEREYLGLHDASSPRRVISEFAPEFPPQRSDYSYGLAEGGERSYFETPTPGTANGSASTFAGFVSDPVFSVPHGLYSGTVEVAIATRTPGAAIYYTLNGTEPTAATGTPYSGPISFSGEPRRAGFFVRAVAVKAGSLPSRVVTTSYIFPEHVLTQPTNPDGFPSQWGNVQLTAADYEMDPDVTGNPTYTSRALEGLTSIPTLSVVLDTNDLFGRTRGIYSNPTSSGVAWERPVSAELINPDGSEGFQVNCGLRMQGGSSTEGWKSIKLSLRLLFKDDYGPAKLDYPLLGKGAVERFNTLVLDAHLNLAWTHPDHAQRVRAQYTRDCYVSDLQNETGSLAPHSAFVNLYLNGLYWGVYDVHEKPDSDFQAEYFGGDESEYDVLRHTGSEVVDGTSAAWNTMMGIARAGVATEAQYQALQGYLNVQDLIDYMIVHLFVGNDDWPRHNWYAARRRVTGAGYRFFSWDSEHVLKDVGLNQTAVNLANSPAELYDRLRRQNAEFRVLFGDRIQRHFFNGGPLYVDPNATAWDPTHPERNRPAALYMQRIDEIDPAIILESARWGDARRPTLPYTRDNEWQTELNLLLTQYFPRRSGIVLGQLRSAGLYPTVAAPVLSRFGGEIEPGFTLSMSLAAGAAGTILYTTDGSDPRVYGTGEVAAGASAYSSPIALDDHTRLKARTLDGANWSALVEATFTVALPAEVLRVTEIMYHPAGGEDYEFIELKNTGAVTVGLDNVYLSKGIAFLFEPGLALGAGEHIVLAANAAAFQSRYPGVPLGGVYSGSLANDGEEVTLRDPAGAVIVSIDYDDEGFWPLGADGFGWSLVIRDPAGDPDDPENWRQSAAAGGSPGADDPDPLHGGIVINEVLTRAAAPLEDAVELRNLTGADVAIGGWFLSDSRADAASLKRFRIPDGAVVPARGYAVFYENQFNPTPGTSPSFELNEDGGAIYLASADAGGGLTGHITGAAFDAAEDGVSFGRHATSAGYDFAALSARTFGADAPATVQEFREGTGAANAPPLVGAVVINEVHYHPAPGDDEFLELHNRTGADIALHDGASGRAWQVNGLLGGEGFGRFEFAPGTTIPARGYLLIVGIDPETFRDRYGVPPFVPIAGPAGGALDNSGERLKLYKPVVPSGSGTPVILVDHVRYNDKEPWPLSPDGAGPSLERTFAGAYGNEALNWNASAGAGGTPGAANSDSNPDGNQLPVAVFTASEQPGGDPRIMVFDASDSFDPDGTIARFDWDFGDGTSARGETVIHAYLSGGTFLVRLSVADDDAAEGSAERAVTVEEPPPAGRMVPGDCNRDARLDISDGVCLLNRLFLGALAELPCDGASLNEGGNRTLLNANGDLRVDLSDAVHVLNFLFLGGPPHVAGSSCAPMNGCPAACSS